MGNVLCKKKNNAENNIELSTRKSSAETSEVKGDVESDTSPTAALDEDENSESTTHESRCTKIKEKLTREKEKLKTYLCFFWKKKEWILLNDIERISKAKAVDPNYEKEVKAKIQIWRKSVEDERKQQQILPPETSALGQLTWKERQKIIKGIFVSNMNDSASLESKLAAMNFNLKEDIINLTLASRKNCFAEIKLETEKTYAEEQYTLGQKVGYTITFIAGLLLVVATFGGSLATLIMRIQDPINYQKNPTYIEVNAFFQSYTLFVSLVTTAILSFTGALFIGSAEKKNDGVENNSALESQAEQKQQEIVLRQTFKF